MKSWESTCCIITSKTSKSYRRRFCIRKWNTLPSHRIVRRKRMSCNRTWLGNNSYWFSPFDSSSGWSIVLKGMTLLLLINCLGIIKRCLMSRWSLPTSRCQCRWHIFIDKVSLAALITRRRDSFGIHLLLVLLPDSCTHVPVCLASGMKLRLELTAVVMIVNSGSNDYNTWTTATAVTLVASGTVLMLNRMLVVVMIQLLLLLLMVMIIDNNMTAFGWHLRRVVMIWLLMQVMMMVMHLMICRWRWWRRWIMIMTVVSTCFGWHRKESDSLVLQENPFHFISISFCLML